MVFLCFSRQFFVLFRLSSIIYVSPYYEKSIGLSNI